MYYVYILRSQKNNRKTYIGLSRNLNKRLLEHNMNTQSYTKVYSPWRVETYIALKNKEKAFNLERYLKVGSGKAFLNRRLIG